MNKARMMRVKAVTRMNERTVPNVNPTLCASEVGKRLNLSAWELVKFQPRFMHRVGRAYAISEDELNALVDSGEVQRWIEGGAR